MKLWVVLYKNVGFLSKHCCVVLVGRIASWFCWLATVPRRKVVFKLLILHPTSSIMFYISHHVKHGIVTTEVVNLSIEVGSDNCGTS